jgi:hypothetical protein
MAQWLFHDTHPVTEMKKTPHPLVFLMSTCALSVLLCWVTLHSGSVWPASIGHSTINVTSGLMKSLMKRPVMLQLGPMSSGVIDGVGFLALALGVFSSGSRLFGVVYVIW